MGLVVSGDASPIQAMPKDAEAAYNGYYKKLCYLVHRLICYVTNLTLAWLVTLGNVDETYMFMNIATMIISVSQYAASSRLASRLIFE